MAVCNHHGKAEASDSRSDHFYVRRDITDVFGKIYSVSVAVNLCVCVCVCVNLGIYLRILLPGNTLWVVYFLTEPCEIWSRFAVARTAIFHN